MMVRKAIGNAAVVAAVVVLLSGCGLRRHKYDNPISKDTQQPDKILFDSAINDIEHSRFERARLTLQTMMNTYDTSEYLAKAKLAIADSWYREGGAHGFAQAEAEYKDFILFYPAMEEAAEAQEKICKMQYDQMEKADRDKVHALRAEDECRQLLVQFPNSKFAPEATQRLRAIQEVLAESEYRVAQLYYKKGSYYAAANRYQGLANQFPLYSRQDEGLWSLADSYRRLGDKYENSQAWAYEKIVRDYPLSPHVDEARERLKAMNRAVPEADPVAVSRMQYERENREKRGVMGKMWGPFSSRPDLTAAAKSGNPQMTGFRPTIPASVPAVAAGEQGTSDVTAAVASDASLLDKNPDARSAAAQAAAAATAGGTATAPAAGAAPANPDVPQAIPIVLTRQGIDINSAPMTDLLKLPGINKAAAQRITMARPFLSVNDLIRVGLSKKTIDRLKPDAAAPGAAAAVKPGTR